MKKPSFPIGVVVTLCILWLGLLGVSAWGWWTMRSASTSTQPTASSTGRPSATESPRTSSSEGSSDGARLVWNQSNLWRFAMKAGGAALVAILFLLLAVGAGVLVQEKAESVNE